VRSITKFSYAAGSLRIPTEVVLRPAEEVPAKVVTGPAEVELTAEVVIGMAEVVLVPVEVT
jgi:hypothetical protein